MKICHIPNKQALASSSKDALAILYFPYSKTSTRIIHQIEQLPTLFPSAMVATWNVAGNKIYIIQQPSLA